MNAKYFLYAVYRMKEIWDGCDANIFLNEGIYVDTA